MIQITQKDLIELIKTKLENATNMEESLRIRATSRDDLDIAKRCFGEARAYQDIISYLEAVEIVPERIEVSPGHFVGGYSMTDGECLDLLRIKSKPLSFKQAMEILKTKARWCEEMKKEKMPYIGLRVYIEETTLKEAIAILERVKGV